MEIITMESFVNLCKYRSFTQAAESMFITQPALSKRISALEFELGVELLHRSSSGFKLTSAGVEFRLRCEQILKLHNEAVQHMNHIRDGISVVLRIGYYNEIHLKIICKIIDSFSIQCPEVELRLFSLDNVARGVEWLDHGKLDVLLSIREDFGKRSGRNFRVFYKNRKYNILVSHLHPYFGRKSILPEDLISQKLALFTPVEKNETHTPAKFLHSVGCGYQNFVFTPDRNTMIAYVCTGKYLGFGGEKSCAPEQVLAGDYIRMIPLEDCSLPAGDLAVEYRLEDKFARLFADVCEECGRDLDDL